MQNYENFIEELCGFSVAVEKTTSVKQQLSTFGKKVSTRRHFLCQLNDAI